MSTMELEKNRIQISFLSMNDGGLTDTDVLCGRGSKTTNHLGNIRFRMFVDAFRARYAKAPRNLKSRVAKKVVDEVHAIGGRFLGYNDDEDTLAEISIKKAIEKACQAMRDEVKSDRKTTPSEKLDDKNKRIIPPRKRHHESPSSFEEESDLFETKPPAKRSRSSVYTGSRKKDGSKKSSEKKNRGAVISTKKKNKYKDKQSNPSKVETSKQRAPLVFNRSDLVHDVAHHDMIELEQLMVEVGPSRPYRLDFTDNGWDGMYEKLLNFRSQFGHTAVAPDWRDHGSDFAEWVVRQRHFYREVLVTVHRTASSEEYDRLMKLKAIDFVWDYGDWHWKSCYKAIATRSTHCRKAKPLLPNLLQEWLSRQRHRLEVGQISGEQAKRLNNLQIPGETDDF